MKKIFTIVCILLFAIFSNRLMAQCAASFTYTTGNNGLVNFTSTSTGTGPFTCSWDYGDTSMYNTSSSHYYWYNNTYNVCLSITDSFMLCSDVVCQPVVVTNATQIASCPGNASFTVAPVGTYTGFANTSGNYSNFYFGDGTSGSGININHQYAFNGSYQVTCIAFSVFGNNMLACDTLTQTITVNNVPCLADMFVYPDTGTGLVYLTNESFGYANTTWYIDGVVVGANVDTLSTILLPGTHTICIATTGPGGCADSSCQSLVLSYTPQCSGVTFSSTPLTGCDNYQFTVNNTGPALNTVNWYLNTNLVSTSLSFPLALNFSSAQNNVPFQTMVVSVTGNGCASYHSFSFTNPAYCGIDMDWDTTGSNGINTWYAYPLANTGVTNELWDFGDGTTTSQTYPTHIYGAPGFYNVCHTITLNSTCTYTYCVNEYFYRMSQGISNFVVVNTTGISNPAAAADKIKVYPIPASDKLNIDYDLDIQLNFTIDISDIAGRKVLSQMLNGADHHSAINLSKLRDGIYYFRLYNNQTLMTSRKIIVAK